jgi:hypothetical protein
MSNEHEAHINANLEVIRLYLLGQFKRFELTHMADHPRSHVFTATKSAEERYELKVSWPQLPTPPNGRNSALSRTM